MSGVGVGGVGEGEGVGGGSIFPTYKGDNLQDMGSSIIS